MPRGRPLKGDGDHLLSRAQNEFLRYALSTDAHGLKKWLRELSDGAMSDRDSLRFIRHDSAIQGQHALRIDSYAPGLFHVTAWPWRDLSLPRRDRRLIRGALKSFGNSRDSEAVLPTKADVLPRLIDPTAWKAGDHFFNMVGAYLLAEEEDFPRRAIAASHIINSLQRAISHPVLGVMSDEIIPLIRRIIGDHPGILLHVLPSWLRLLAEMRKDRLRFAEQIRHDWQPPDALMPKLMNSRKRAC